jgi:hypothetical protein
MEFLFNFIPNMVFHLIVVFSILGVLLAFTLPIPNVYKIGIQFLSVLILVFGVYFEGALSNENQWKLKVAEAEKHIAELTIESENANTYLVAQLAENEKLQNEYKYATRTEIVKVEKIINKKCVIDPNVIRIHNSAVHQK